MTVSPSRPIETYKERILVLLQAGVEKGVTQEFNTHMYINLLPIKSCRNAGFHLYPVWPAARLIWFYVSVTFDLRTTENISGARKRKPTFQLWQQRFFFVSAIYNLCTQKNAMVKKDQWPWLSYPPPPPALHKTLVIKSRFCRSEFFSNVTPEVIEGFLCLFYGYVCFFAVVPWPLN
jgi:hypothetical protein